MVPLIIVHNGLGVLLFCALFAFMCDALKEIKASITGLTFQWQCSISSAIYWI